MRASFFLHRNCFFLFTLRLFVFLLCILVFFLRAWFYFFFLRLALDQRLHLFFKLLFLVFRRLAWAIQLKRLELLLTVFSRWLVRQLVFGLSLRVLRAFLCGLLSWLPVEIVSSIA